MEKGKPLNVAIVGGGPGCKAIMDMIFAKKLSQLHMNLVGVADLHGESVGCLFAREKGVFTTTDYRDFYDFEDLNMIIELTGREDASFLGKEAAHSVPMGVGYPDKLHVELTELFGKYHVHDSLAPGSPAHNSYIQWHTLFHGYSLSNNLSWMLSNPPLDMIRMMSSGAETVTR